MQYQNYPADYLIEPFLSERHAKVIQMYEEGKTSNPVNSTFTYPEPPHYFARLWVDHAAAQEFIDFVTALAPTYNVTITSSTIEDL
jgi:hypothetical protein